jgi:2-polyprenyl-3-methyl-5-hydroxy-6-metoxy-1,4-benzoquinol methylase
MPDYDSSVATTELSAYPPDGFELRLIERFVNLRRTRVLEIGCGDGRLTFQYASASSSVLALDPDRASIDEAAYQREARGIANVDFRVGSIEHLPARGAPFDVALFSWSL